MHFFYVVTFALLLGGVIESQSRGGQTEPSVGQPGKDVMWVPTPPELIEKMLDMAQVSARDVLIDLGSGDGRLVIAAANRGAIARGIEYESGLVELSRRLAVGAAVDSRVTFVKADLFDVDLSSATVITMFLTPDINLALRERLLELRPGTRIVSNTWDMSDWEADEVAVIDPCQSWCTSLLWNVPARVQGIWRTEQGEFSLQQRFQVVSGELYKDENSFPIEDGRLHGDRISFRLGDRLYSGQVVGASIRGTSMAGDQTFVWAAERVKP